MFASFLDEFLQPGVSCTCRIGIYLTCTVLSPSDSVLCECMSTVPLFKGLIDILANLKTTHSIAPRTHMNMIAFLTRYDKGVAHSPLRDPIKAIKRYYKGVTSAGEVWNCKNPKGDDTFS